MFYPALPISIMLEWAAGGEGFPFSGACGSFATTCVEYLLGGVSASASVLVRRVQVRKVFGCCHVMALFIRKLQA